MYNYHSQLVTALNTILPVHYEMQLTSGAALPCISYMELTNFSEAEGDTLRYSVVSYQVKVWAKTVAEIQQYAAAIDTKMTALGFTRTSSAELSDNQTSIIQKVLTYEGKALETV